MTFQVFSRFSAAFQPLFSRFLADFLQISVFRLSLFVELTPICLFRFSVGGFDKGQVATGEIADFNLWNYVISPRSIDSVTCGATGNIVSWATLTEKGFSNKYYNQSLENCGKLTFVIVSCPNVGEYVVMWLGMYKNYIVRST